MRKRTNSDRQPKQRLYSEEAGVKKLDSLFNDPYFQLWSTTGSAAGIRRKILSIDYEVLRNLVQRVPLLNAVITARSGQLIPFCQRSEDQSLHGFKIVNVKNPNAKEDKNADKLAEFFEQTGFMYSEDREDDFADFAQMFVRDTIVIDQLATELQQNRRGEPIAFWALDPASIQRIDPEKSNFNEDVRYVQLVNMKVTNTYTAKTMVFDYMNKRSDLRHRGFGYSVVEQVVDLATTLLFGYNYIRDQLIRDRIPKGFISVMGDVGGTEIDSIRRYWYAAMSGSGGQWNIPILPSGKDGIGIDFKNLGQNNKDMEYHKTMMFISSLVAAVASIDLAELGIKADDSTALIGEQSDARLKASKNRGLGSLIAYFQQHCNKILRKVTTDYRFKIVGFEKEDELAKTQILAQQVKAYKTLNEIREGQGIPRMKEYWADIVLDPSVVQMVMQAQAQQQQEKQQQAQQQQQSGGFGEEEQGGGEEAQGEGNTPFGSDSEEDMFKALTDAKIRQLLDEDEEE